MWHGDVTSFFVFLFFNMSSYFWFLLLLTVTAATSECPQDCVCSPIRNRQTPYHDHAICTTLNTINGTYPNIHSLDLSSINMDSIPIELSSLHNVTHLDLSKNHLTKLTKLNNRIRSLDLSHNRLTPSEIVKISPKIRILNLAYNQITRLPLDVMHFKSLKSINLIGNRIDCSCETLTVRDWLYQNNVWIGKHTLCASPLEVRHQPWDKVSIKKMCSIAEQINDENKIELHRRSSRELELSDFIAEEFLPFESHSILKRQVPNDDNLSNIVDGSGSDDIPEDVNDIVDVGSGEGSGTDPDIDIEAIENISPEDYEDEPYEEDGSGSGFGLLPLDVNIKSAEEENHTTEEPDVDEPLGQKPMDLDIFEGIKQGDGTTIGPVEAIEPMVQKVNQGGVERVAPIAVQPAGNSLIEPSVASNGAVEDAKKEEGRSTYILLAILGILLVCLIGYVIVKRRKNRRRPYDHNDAENIREIEMLDMKKNTNGQHPNVEIVPLMPKKEQPKIERGMGDPIREINSNIQPLHATTYPKVDAVPLKQNDVPHTTDALPENNNNFTEVQPSPTQDIPKTADEIDDNPNNKPTQNGHNGHPSDDEVFLPEEATVKRYSPVYSPETGRVKIKLTETPKPKTPIVVTRSRSNAGAYITTPNLNVRSTSDNGQ
ncbi:protein windpipe isoform X2 [Bradysia coprophila]|uniref:protein windpipe isoform X2 n=1 Tax=Bradysia coprophila TaxID=38358 RepID=UPI00187D795A|nr:protein windpipe isoform X2 [Bradysia coprophila]